ncbi:MAG TPA: OmpA family protein [Vicinamibacterales bacterium]|nr:OmpA family protein [Vicinamibacterales bacterium]
MRRIVLAVPVMAFVLAGSTACASKKFVNTRVGEVNTKVDTLGRSVEETQERTRANERRITEVDQKAAAAGMTAEAARNAANIANTRVETLDAASKRLVYSVTLSEDKGNFKLNRVEIPDEAKAEIDNLVNQLKANPNGAWIEIEGHTDATGSNAYNMQLGEKRAEQVKRYLYERHQVPLHKMNVISFGEEKPVADNKTRDGRAQNRRVVIKVLT